MESRHVSAVLFAKDFRRLAAFYRDVVGLAPLRPLDDHAVLATPDSTLIGQQIPARFLTDTGPAPPRRREDGAIGLSAPCR